MKKPKQYKDNEYAIAVIAGGGSLPSLLISHLKKTKKDFVVICLEGNADASIADGQNHISIRFGEAGKALGFLKENNVRQIVFVGKIQRPSLIGMKLDMKGLALLGKVGIEVFKSGDDKILSYVVKLLEDQGFEIIAPEKLLPSLLAPSGVLGKIKPGRQDYEDIATGKNVLAALGPWDVGQAVIVENGYVLGIEAAEGTDKLIERCGKLRKEKSASGMLLKMKKHGQETRIDLPGIGIKTISQAYESGLRGVAFEAKASIIVDIDAVIKKADELKLFLIGVTNS
jgi:DUF1009 family protein